MNSYSLLSNFCYLSRLVCKNHRVFVSLVKNPSYSNARAISLPHELKLISSLWIFSIHLSASFCASLEFISKLLNLMGENIGLGSVLPQSKKELHKQGDEIDFPSILAKRLNEIEKEAKSFLYLLGRCVFESTLEPNPRKDGLGCPLAYSPIGLNGQQVTSGEGHEGKGIISLAFQSHPRVPERATSK